MATNSLTQPSVQLSYPSDKLVAIVDAMPDAEQARQELLAAGFGPDAIGVQHGTGASEQTVDSTEFEPFPAVGAAAARSFDRARAGSGLRAGAWIAR